MDAKDVMRTYLRQCGRCGARETRPRQFLACGDCKKQKYCGATCQKRDWKVHKQVCSKEYKNKKHKT